jgi:hypothetical protein
VACQSNTERASSLWPESGTTTERPVPEKIGRDVFVRGFTPAPFAHLTSAGTDGSRHPGRQVAGRHLGQAHP